MLTAIFCVLAFFVAWVLYALRKSLFDLLVVFVPAPLLYLGCMLLAVGAVVLLLVAKNFILNL